MRVERSQALAGERPAPPAAAANARLAAVGARVRPRGLERTRATTFVYVATAAYGVAFATAATLWHLAFQTARFDLGNMTQAVWSTAHGHFLSVTALDGRQMSRLGSHVDPFLALLAPLFRVWPSPILLLVLQALAVTSGALPVYWLARKHLENERAAVHFAVAYLVFPTTQWNAFTASSDFHPASFAIPLILYALWFLDGDRLLPFAACALLAASTKEQMPLVVGCLGIWYAVTRRRVVVGGCIFLVGAAATAVAFLVVIPHFALAGAHPFADRYAAVGGSPGGVLRTLVTHPQDALAAVATWHKLVYVALLLVPFLGLWAFSPVLLLCAVPELVLNLLSSKPEQTTLTFHYTAGIAPYVIAASILGAARFKRHARRLSLYALAGALSLCVLSPFAFAPGRFARALPSNAAHRATTGALALVPPGVPVSASNHLGAQLSERRRILTFPYVREARWIVVDANDETIEDRRGYRRLIARYLKDRHWRLVYSRRGVIVLHHT